MRMRSGRPEGLDTAQCLSPGNREAPIHNTHLLQCVDTISKGGVAKNVAREAGVHLYIVMGLLGNESGLTDLAVVLLTKADMFLRGCQFESQSKHPTEMN